MQRRELFKACAGALAAVGLLGREALAEPEPARLPWRRMKASTVVSDQEIMLNVKYTLLDHLAHAQSELAFEGCEPVKLYMTPACAEKFRGQVSDTLVYPDYAQLYYSGVPIEVQDGVTAMHPFSEYGDDWAIPTQWNEHGFVFATREKRTQRVMTVQGQVMDITDWNTDHAVAWSVI